MIKVYETINEIPWLRIRFKDDSLIGLIVESNDEDKVGTEYRSKVEPSENKNLMLNKLFPVLKKLRDIDMLVVAFYSENPYQTSNGEVVNTDNHGVFKIGEFSKSWASFNDECWRDLSKYELNFYVNGSIKFPIKFNLNKTTVKVEMSDFNNGVIIVGDDICKAGEFVKDNYYNPFNDLSLWTEIKDATDGDLFGDSHYRVENSNTLKGKGDWTICPDDFSKLDGFDSSKNNGGSTDYYRFDITWNECQDVIEARNMNFAQGNIFKASFCFNKGRHDATTYERELNKIKYFCDRELELIKNAKT